MSDQEKTDPHAPKPAPQPEQFSKEYVHELREESKAQRLKVQEAETKLNELTAATKKANDEAAAKIAEAKTLADQRIIRAELKAEAIKAGMIDLDDLRLADLSKITLDEKGEVQGADGLMVKLKETKPYLFKAVSTTSTKEPPKPGDIKPKKAQDMTEEEYAIARRQFR